MEPVVLAKDAPNSGVAQVLTCLSSDGFGLTSDELQRLATDVVRRSRTVSAIRGEAFEPIGLDQLVEREVGYIKTYCDYAEVAYPGDAVIEEVLRKISDRRPVTKHDRCITGGLTLDRGFGFLYGFNARQKREEDLLNLAHSMNEEWWRTDSRAELLPTVSGVFTLDLARVMLPTDMKGRPFYLSYDEQVAWAENATGLATAEQVIYLFGRYLLECARPMWGAGSVRVRNVYGSGSSLGVSFDAGNGFGLYNWYRSYRYWYLGAFPEVLEFVS